MNNVRIDQNRVWKPKVFHLRPIRRCLEITFEKCNNNWEKDEKKDFSVRLRIAYRVDYWPFDGIERRWKMKNTKSINLETELYAMVFISAKDEIIIGGNG